MEIVLIGTGNTATVLGKKLKAAGHRIVQVYGRNPIAAAALAHEFGASSTNNLKAVAQNAELSILAVSDGAVEEVAAKLPFHYQTLVHTAASVSKEVLKGKATRYGVLYPLQSLKKEAPLLPEIPVLVDAGDAETLAMLKTLAGTISTQVSGANDDMRVKMHLAAVMVNNFTNHLFALVDNYCKEEGLQFSMLLPLMKETVLRLNDMAPASAQTGPAIRGDGETIKKHLHLLEQSPQLKTFYELFSESIRRSRFT